MLTYYKLPSFEIQANTLRIMKVLEEPLGEPNMKR